MNKKEQDTIFSSWFELKPLRQDGIIGSQLVCTNPYLASLIRNLHRQYKFKIGTANFMAESAFCVYNAIGKFEIDKGQLEDDINQRKLFTYVKNTLTNQAIRFSNPETLFTTQNINGKRQHIKIVIMATSLEKVLMEDETEETLHDVVASEANLFGPKSGYKVNEFIEWFSANKAALLTEKELHILEVLPQYITDSGTYSMEQVEQTGVRNKHLKRVNLFGPKSGYKVNEFIEWFSANKAALLTEKELHILEVLPQYITDSGTYSMEQVEQTGVRNKHLKRVLERIEEKAAYAYQEEPMKPSLVGQYKNLAKRQEVSNEDIKDWLKEAMNTDENFTLLVQDFLCSSEQRALNRWFQGKDDLSSAILFKINEGLMMAKEKVQEPKKMDGWPPKPKSNVFMMDANGVLLAVG